MGTGGIGIVRVSGPESKQIAIRLLGRQPKTRIAEFGSFVDEKNEAIDSGIALFFEGPYSYTGEDVLELHGHGGIVVQQLVCERVLELGARLAEPGEFTQRAYLNNRIDLAQAEAVADLINASSAEAARASSRSLSGLFSKEVHALDENILRVRAYVEAAIDFADEDIDFLSDQELQNQVEATRAHLLSLLTRTREGATLHQGLTVVIAGAPNVGKSSLLNALLNEDRAIVTEVAGTTRDTLSERIHIHGMPVRLIDTAGLHESEDRIEEEGIARAQSAIEKADLILWVTEDEDVKLPSELPTKHLMVLNKCDLTFNEPGLVSVHTVRISALQNTGLNELRELIAQIAGHRLSDDAFSGRPRHISALEAVRQHLQKVEEFLADSMGELVAEELRQAHQQLGKIVGETTTEDLLGEIFSNFCIGK
ncbi:MAG: tRNA uridine-5-carboxymethylaminomethyl(34) synthesis GTPase MnmE [Gammaproteobacteria bacterium]|nr:tRNA uridine-5-carboxymethylaminomethyl(34) synthesis GTPase MnmE [Gammaproteobacteria bacterium]